MKELVNTGEEKDYFHILKKKKKAGKWSGKGICILLLWLISFGFGVFFSKTWQGFALPGAHHCATPLWLHWSHFQLQTDLRALLSQWEVLCWGYGQGCRWWWPRQLECTEAACIFYKQEPLFWVFCHKTTVQHEEAAVASSCYKHFERAHLFTHIKLHFPNLSVSSYSFLGGKHTYF